MHTALRKFTFAAIVACVSMTPSFQVDAADDADARSASQEAVRIADSSVPGKSDSAETAFRKLDRDAKGFVTYDDVAVLPDFATAFGNADSSHLGRLNLTAFTQAWTAYAKGSN